MRTSLSRLLTLVLLGGWTQLALGQQFRWAADGVHLQQGEKWFDAETGEEVEPIDVPAAPDPRGELRDAFAAALTRALGDEEAATQAVRGQRSFSTLPRSPQPTPGMSVSADNTRAALVHDGVLWAFDGQRGMRRVRDGLDGVRHFEISPDGARVRYLLGHDLHVAALDGLADHALSTDGGENLFYGELDWVYQEEVYGRGNFQGAWWSPTGEHLAFVRIDEEGVDTFTVVDHVPDQLGIENLKYPKAGRTNPRATLHVARADDGSRVAVDLSQYSPEQEILIVRVGWTPEGDRVVFKVQNREQTWLDLLSADPETGAVHTLIHEQAGEFGWVNVLSMPRWLEDGSFLWESERTGYKHLYRYERDGTLRHPVTSGEWQVRRIQRMEEAAGAVSFAGTKDSAIGPHVYRVGLDGQGLVRLTEGRGSHSVQWNGAGSLLIDRFSSLENPGETWLRRVDGSAVRLLDEQELPENANVPALHSVPARDGETLDVTVQKPSNFDESQKYPVWIDTYSGPAAPTVRDSWRGPTGPYADRGIVLLQVNVRSASGRGQKYTSACYRQFGVQELKDIEDALTWLTSNHSWTDATRVGISGWSYGGFMAAYALTHSKLFKCGIAGAGVYDWRLYDTIYTERYMAKPQNNADGYAISSVREAAAELHGHLLIVHGTMDDNVHMQNAIQFVHELQKANKDNFTFMLYPKARHGVRSGHLSELRRRFIEENL